MLTSPHPILRFDPERSTSNKELKTDIAALIRHLESEERRLGLRQRERRDESQRAFRLAAKALACNLAATAMASPEATISVPRAHGSMWGNGRYRNPLYGQHFVDLLDLLSDLGLVEEITKGRHFENGSGQPTTIRPTPILQTWLRTRDLKTDAFRQEEAPEVVFLKPVKDDDNRAPPIEYEDTKHTERWRREVKRLNAWLRDAPIHLIEQNPEDITADTNGHPVECYRRNLRRIFNNADWKQGGRLFGGFWMTMERTSRFRLLRVMGEPAVNVDYSALFPRLVYVRARQGQPEGDLYDMTGDGSCRDGWKKLTNALLFKSNPLKQWPKNTSALFPPGTHLKQAVAAIKAKHSPIAHLFEHGIGFELMRIESDMSVALVTALFKRGITALPLHDSVLTAKSHGETAKTLMEEMFMARTGSPRAFVKIDEGQ